MKNKVVGALRVDNFVCCRQRQTAEIVEGSSLLVTVTSTEEK